MPVTTRRQSRGLRNSNVIGWLSDNSPSANFTRELDDDDPMDGSITGLSASEDDEDYESMGDEHGPGAYKGDSNHGESDDAESDVDFGGVSDAANDDAFCANCTHSKTPRRQTS
jgi:hypothetical protein